MRSRRQTFISYFNPGSLPDFAPCFTVRKAFVTLIAMAQPANNAKANLLKGNISVIASRENRWLKRFRAALSGEREDDGFVGVEGVRLVEAALGSGLSVE